MTDKSRPNAREDAERRERDLLARLGLTFGANSEEVAAAHDEIVRFVADAPFDLRDWAHRATAAADDAFALLSDTTSDLDVPATAEGTVSDPDVELEPEAEQAGDSDEIEEDLEPRRSRLGVLKRLAAGAALVVAALAVAVVGYNLGGGAGVAAVSGTPAPSSAAAPSLDPAQVTALMQKIAADPKDVTSLTDLANLYFGIGDFKTAADWISKILVIEPTNVDALLALGTAQYNLGDPTSAEKQWRAAIAVDPKYAQAYYLLGFIYLNQSPPDMAKLEAAWDKVVEIDPTSDLAKTVATHLQSLTGSPAPSGAAPASSGPDASAAPSATPSTPTASPAASGR